MSITDELREHVAEQCSYLRGAKCSGYNKMLEIADRIDEQHEAMESYWQGASYKDGYDEGFASADDWLADHEDAMAEHGWIRLPVDADGVPIHIGDVMAYMDNTKPMEVVALVPPAVFLTEDGPRYADMCRHRHAPTVEDVLREFAEKVIDSQIPSMHPTYEEAITEYAAKLRLAGEDA